MKGILYLIPSPLSDCEVNQVIPQGVLDIISKVDIFIVEELRTARRYLSRAGRKGEIDNLTFYLLNEHTKEDEIIEYIKIIQKGSDVALISEAGLPAVADPGAKLVELAHNYDICVNPLVGPSSLMLALMASGKNGQNFSFIGYLPIKSSERRAKIKELEILSNTKGVSNIIIETPYRNIALLNDIISACAGSTKLTIACDLTSSDSLIKTKSLSFWKSNMPDINKKPAVFIL